MFKSLLDLFPKKKISVTFQLNDHVMPIDRGELYEQPIKEILEANGWGELEGGGTMQLQSGEIEYIDVHVGLKAKFFEEGCTAIIKKLEEIGAPKGSIAFVYNSKKKPLEIPFGRREGLAIYLDMTNLNERVYEETDINDLYSELEKLTETEEETRRFWQSDTETALYFFGESFEKLNAAIQPLVRKHPRCENARIVQIA